MDTPASLRLWRLRELLGGVVVVTWAAVHLWEQWAAFRGREAFVTRLMRTSHGTGPLLLELLFGVLPVVSLCGLEVWLRLRTREPVDLASAMAEEPALALRLGRIVRGATWAMLGWLLWHVAWLWSPKLTEGSEPVRAWLLLRDNLGQWPHAAVMALGLSAFALHLWAAPVRLSVTFGWATTPEARRSARLSGLIVALGFLLLYAELAGWHAAGAGTIWTL